MYIVTGANGQLGYQIKRLLGNNAIYVNKSELDITDTDNVAHYFNNKKFDAIINCAAYTAVDKAEDEKELAYKVNVDGAKNLALIGLPIVHISTDYVFSGENYMPYVETDVTTPLGVYGNTKLLGEQAVLECAKTAVVLRTSWLYSEYANNFFKTMIKLGNERESLNVVVDQVGTPTYAGDLAQTIVKILPKIASGSRELYHYSNEGVCSWYDFATEIMNTMNISCKVNPIPSKDYPTKAKRPFYSVLNKSKIKADFGISIDHWKKGLDRCIAISRNI